MPRQRHGWNIRSKYWEGLEYRLSLEKKGRQETQELFGPRYARWSFCFSIDYHLLQAKTQWLGRDEYYVQHLQSSFERLQLLARDYNCRQGSCTKMSTCTPRLERIPQRTTKKSTGSPKTETSRGKRVLRKLAIRALSINDKTQKVDISKRTRPP